MLQTLGWYFNYLFLLQFPITHQDIGNFRKLLDAALVFKDDNSEISEIAIEIAIKVNLQLGSDVQVVCVHGPVERE